MKFNEVFKKMVEQSGVSVTDATIEKIIGNKELASLEVDDAVSSKLTAERFTFEAAKSNPELHKHFKATILDGVDQEVKRLADEHGFEDSDKTELKSAENSFKRIALLSSKIKTLTEKKAGSTGKDKDALTKEVEKLNSELLTIKTDHQTAILAKETAFNDERTGWKLESVFNEFIPKMDKKNSSKINLTIARTVVTDELAKKGLKIVNKDGNLSLLTSTDTQYFENNTPIALNDFVSKTLANEKLLVASDPTPKKDSIKVVTTPVHGELNTSKMDAALAE